MKIYLLMFLVCHVSGDLSGAYNKSCKWEQNEAYREEAVCAIEGQTRLNEIVHSFTTPGKREAWKCEPWNIK